MPFYIDPAEAGVTIDDQNPSSTQTYSSQKIEAEIANIVTGATIDDQTPSSTQTYSSQKIEAEIANIDSGVTLDQDVTKTNDQISGHTFDAYAVVNVSRGQPVKYVWDSNKLRVTA